MQECTTIKKKTLKGMFLVFSAVRVNDLTWRYYFYIPACFVNLKKKKKALGSLCEATKSASLPDWL